MRFFCVVIGYLCGCFLTADCVARHKARQSVFEIGTRNPGMANIAGSFGARWAAVTLLGELLKTVLPCVLCRYLLFRPLGRTAVLYTGLGVALGHGFPFWHGFRGGRSVAVTCISIVLFSPLWGILANLAGLGVVIGTGYLALGALAIPCLFLVPAFLLFGLEAGLVASAGTALLFFLHRDSIRRMVHKSENKVDLLAKLKNR